MFRSSDQPRPVSGARFRLGNMTTNKAGLQGDRIHLHGMTKEEVIAIAVGTTCGVLLLLLAAVLLCRCYYRKRKWKHSSYEQIVPQVTSTVVTPTMSMKTIPFTVPGASGATQGGRRTENQHPVPGDTESNPGSEPASPLHPANRRSSMDSTGGADFGIRNAYTLGSIDPSLYKITDDDDDYEYPDDHIGRIWFAVEYERETEKLLVTLMKAKNLRARGFGGSNTCDPFVRIYLMPDERRYLQSKFKKKTCNPKYEESFVFQVSQKGIQDRILKLTVYDVDRHKRHNVVGHALYPLREHDYESNERVVIWRDLEREVVETTSDRGEVRISLSYNNHLERITIGVYEGKSFKKLDGTSTPDFYVKVCLLLQNKVVKTKKTEVTKRSINPAFNESFTYKLSVNSLDMASVTVTAMQHLTGQRDKSLGRVILGSFMFARGKELDHWNEMVANQREQINHWHTLT